MIMNFLRTEINHSAQSRQNNLQFCLTRFFVMAYRLPAPHKTGAGFDSLNKLAGSRLYSVMRFFCARNTTLSRIMAGRNGGALCSLVSQFASLSTLLRLATTFDSVVARLLKLELGAFHMAISTRPDFIWRFMQCHGKNIRLHTVTAASEREARALLPASRLVFVARIRVREACHV
ncbi:host cell division inhibitor Icd-like protein [Escherichia coli]|uniref:host cell division inhibitor Icd-like protein n=1 Tax=Escherichia coli TaxID=562 RepID=UPI0017E9FF01|nr:host cell division inhibitor Icd-like protein [Escherichia coli]EEW5973208.1 host cell division inhibitor Icd-like protein [Escherichia coli]EEY5897668.1 host cell division inhibitor Icd-like protein [Escherichia coli]EFB9699335.1 host cell division inhibitor Icd-like protein [Escherichia coli]MCP8786189.1 host cell division inhibitor Icd-like protein [Escherichia coli]HCN6368616.1 host cell division inhibitor Icd-like protein [Escherichia coli]